MAANKLKQNLTILIFSLVLTLNLYSKTMIVPFKVTPTENTTHQWLGRAVSFFLSTGLRMNSIKIISETKVISILHENNIRFPYHITKASGIKLGLENKVEFMVWGDIVTSSDQVELRSYIINLKNFSQKYLPLLKFEIKNFFTLQKELLKEVLKFYKKNSESVITPQLNLDYYNYELLIKSFLVNETSEKINFLEKVYQNRPDSDFLNFELAKVYMSQQNYKRANFFLEKVSDNTIFFQEKNFLNALILLNYGYSNLAIEKFIKLQEEGRFSFEIDNNLGAVYLKHKHYPTAEKYFLSALNKKKDHRLYLNYLKLLIDSKKGTEARNTTNTALLYFPSNKKMRELFFFYLSKDNNKNILRTVFKKYLPDPPASETLPEINIQLINPLNISMNNSNHFQNELNKFMKYYSSGNPNKTVEDCENILEINPFIPELHHLISSIYLKQKKLFESEMYAISSNYLKKTKDNFLILIEIHKLLNNEKRLNELRTELSKLSSENKR